ncbi:sodium/hydrogen exchanger 8 [Heracleum sosnowskyi]|uniref:Sodium/hydrogen exchanger 8 n=1 Tax=Heracleum sosnowskyi TaxID=360622 RepID=A0AAD8ILF7_9APIA|nr:sodium/hydrogen exchanger 8 [Heracleum sosnowskyi]
MSYSPYIVKFGQLARIERDSNTNLDSISSETAILFVGISLLLGISSRQLLKGTKVPYTVALLIIGIALGSIEFGTHHHLGKIGDGIRLWANIDPDLLLAVFLPALLFESSFTMEVHQIKKCMVQMLLLAGPGVLISTFLLGAAIKLIFPYNWSWTTSLLLGGLLGATDPVAVVAHLKELGASKKLSTMIEGESVMNDGIAIVVFQLFFRMATGSSMNWAAVVKYLAQVSLGAVGIGIAFGLASILWLKYVFNDTVIEITLTVAVSYIAYFTAQEWFDVSGVLTVMTLGMFYAAVARTAFRGDGQQSLHHFWEMIAYIANTLIFILSGVVIAEGVLGNSTVFKSHEYSWGYLILLYVFVQISRIAVVAVLYPCLRYFGYGLDWREAAILVWSGLRGAVALSLSLSVKRSSDNASHISPETGILFVFFTGGIVFLTLVLNGSTTQFILHFLDLDKLSASKRRILEYTKYEMMNKALEIFGDFGDDEELGPADWPTVKEYIATLSGVDGEQAHLHTQSHSDDKLDIMNLEDIRIRFLNGVQAAYWEMVEEGRITQKIANLLMQSVDEALDLIRLFPQKIVTYFIVGRLESACYICSAFLRAHRISRRQLHEFIGESEVTSTVFGESEIEGEEAKKFLEDVRVTFPQVLHVLKTRQVTCSVLKHLGDYVQNLEKVGLLEKKEIVHLHDAVQIDVKKLLRNPPLVKIPKAHDLVSVNPLLGALPPTTRETLLGSTKMTMKLRGSTLYKEGTKPIGIWIILNGVVEWESKSMRNKHSLHPTVMYGSSLGLYEVVTGRPYICDMITDSTVLCFFIEAEKIVALSSSDPAIDDFFWKESATVLAKILLPEIFENIPMQEVRGLVAEKSTMRHRIQEELIASPAALMPLYGEMSSQGSETSGVKSASFFHQASCYQVESRAKVIMLNIAAYETNRAMQLSMHGIMIDDDAETHSQGFPANRRGTMMGESLSCKPAIPKSSTESLWNRLIK